MPWRVYRHRPHRPSPLPRRSRFQPTRRQPTRRQPTRRLRLRPASPSSFSSDLRAFLRRQLLGPRLPALQATFSASALRWRLGGLWVGRVLYDPISHLVEIGHGGIVAPRAATLLER